MPIYLVSYDIKEPKLLQRVAKKLQAEGLERILKSVFLGPIRSLNLRKLQRWLEQELTRDEKDRGSIVLIPLRPSQIDALVSIGPVQLDQEEIKGSKHTLFY